MRFRKREWEHNASEKVESHFNPTLRILSRLGWSHNSAMWDTKFNVFKVES